MIEGQPFDAGRETRAMLDRAAKTGYKMSRVLGFEEVVERQLASASIRTGTGSIPMPTARPSPSQEKPIDLSWVNTAARLSSTSTRAIWFFTDYYSISPGMLSQTSGQGCRLR